MSVYKGVQRLSIAVGLIVGTTATVMLFVDLPDNGGVQHAAQAWAVLGGCVFAGAIIGVALFVLIRLAGWVIEGLRREA